MDLLETTEGFRCGDGIYRVQYKLLDMVYHNYDPITKATIYPDLELGELYRVRATLMAWVKDEFDTRIEVKLISRIVDSPIFKPKHFRESQIAMSVLGDSIIWVIKSQAEPRLVDKYRDEMGRVVLNPLWEPCEEPDVIRDDSVLEIFNYRETHGTL